MEQPTAVIEITNSVIRIVIGYVVEGKPCIIYTREAPTRGSVQKGEIIDQNTLVQILSEFRSISDREARLRINVKEASVILPPLAFSIFQTTKVTNTVSPNSVIETIDIQNAVSQVRKENIPNSTDVIDIIPAVFQLDGNILTREPPLGQKSNTLTLRAFIHTLPIHLKDSYRDTFDKAGIVMKRPFVSPYAIGALAQTQADMPSDFLLIDMGEELTDITIIGRGLPYASTYFIGGAKFLKEKVSKDFGISLEDAQHIIELYGVDSLSTNFSPVIARSIREDGSVVNYRCKDLNLEIDDFMKDYFKQLDASLTTLFEGCKEEVKRLPIVVTGGFSNLNGLEKYLKDKFNDGRDIKFLAPKALGVRDPKYSAAVGTLLLSLKYRGSLTDQRAKVSQVTRENESNNG